MFTNAARRGAGAAAAAMLLVSLGACGSAGSDGAAPSSDPTTAKAAVKASDGTVFEGPYATMYRDGYEDAKTDLAKGILKDGKITDEEWEEAKNALIACAAEKGVTVKFENSQTSAMSWKAPAGTSDDDFKKMGEDERACETSTDFEAISAIVDFSANNPNNEDLTGDVVKCLVSNGLAGDGMTAEEYKQIMSDEDRMANTFGRYTDPSRPEYDSAGAQKFESCHDDPAANTK